MITKKKLDSLFAAADSSVKLMLHIVRCTKDNCRICKTADNAKVLPVAIPKIDIATSTIRIRRASH